MLSDSTSMCINKSIPLLLSKLLIISAPLSLCYQIYTALPQEPQITVLIFSDKTLPFVQLLAVCNCNDNISSFKSIPNTAQQTLIKLINR